MSKASSVLYTCVYPQERAPGHVHCERSAHGYNGDDYEDVTNLEGTTHLNARAILLPRL